MVEDKNPIYDYVETSRGHEKANINLFNLKEKYRIWINGGHKIHTTNSTKETNHDSVLLLGLNYEDIKTSLPCEFDNKIKKIKRNITGAFGWKNVEEVFTYIGQILFDTYKDENSLVGNSLFMNKDNNQSKSNFTNILHITDKKKCC